MADELDQLQEQDELINQLLRQGANRRYRVCVPERNASGFWKSGKNTI